MDRPTPKGSRKRRSLPPAEQEISHSGISGGLAQEISLLRSAVRRMLELSGELGDPEKTIRALSAVALAASRLAGLIRVEHMVSDSPENTAVSALNKALEEIALELQR